MIGGDGGVLSTPPVPESHIAPLERVLLFLQRLFRPLRQWRGWERISQWEALRAIRNSASLRAASYLAAVSMVLILVAGTIVATQLRSSVFESRRTAVLSDAALRFSTAQSVFDQSTASTPDQIQESTRQLATSLRVSASGTGAVSVLLLRSQSQSQSLRINEIVDPTVLGVISEEMKNAVAGSTDPQWQSVSIPSARDANQRVPAILVGRNVQVPRAGIHQLYIVYSLQADQERIDTVMGILIFAGIPFLLLIPIITFILIYHILGPVRRTATAAGKLAEGNLDVRIDSSDARGSDEMANLGRAFNNMAESLEKKIDEYDELSRLQQRFVSDVSHELRTPLTTIRMAEEMIWDQRKNFDPVTTRSAELLHEQVERFDSMLADLLEISRHDAQSVDLAAESIDLRGLVTRVVNANSELAQRLGVEVIVNAPTHNCTAEIDDRRIERVIRNLLVNAYEHAESRPVVVTIASNETAVAVRVRDHGVGMEPATVERVFDRFYRADPARTRTTGGTGLGLAISLEDVVLHGGTLTAWGEIGVGSSFMMTLPKKVGTAISSDPLELWEKE